MCLLILADPIKNLMKTGFVILPGPIIKDYSENGVGQSIFTGIALNRRKKLHCYSVLSLTELNFSNKRLEKNSLKA